MFEWLFNLFRSKPRLPAHPLIAVARSANTAARQKAAEELGAIAEDWATDELFRLVADGTAPVREAAVAGLRHQGARALPILLRNLNHQQPAIAAASADLLGAFPSAEVVEKLLMSLKFGERPVQVAARRALGRCGQAAVPALRAALNETQPWLHAQITGALAEAEAVKESPAPEGSPVMGDAAG
jgi:HEAT repeat protein